MKRIALTLTVIVEVPTDEPSDLSIESVSGVHNANGQYINAGRVIEWTTDNCEEIEPIND